jgi:hypothetical protein
MESLTQFLAPLNEFITSKDFFWYHGVVLGSLWLCGSVIAILARRIAVTIHALLFFLIDATTAFFIVGGMLRVYPHIATRWDDWGMLKQGHFVGGK